MGKPAVFLLGSLADPAKNSPGDDSQTNTDTVQLVHLAVGRKTAGSFLYCR